MAYGEGSTKNEAKEKKNENEGSVWTLRFLQFMTLGLLKQVRDDEMHLIEILTMQTYVKMDL